APALGRHLRQRRCRRPGQRHRPRDLCLWRPAAQSADRVYPQLYFVPGASGDRYFLCAVVLPDPGPGRTLDDIAFSCEPLANETWFLGKKYAWRIRGVAGVDVVGHLRADFDRTASVPRAARPG